LQKSSGIAERLKPEFGELVGEIFGGLVAAGLSRPAPLHLACGKLGRHLANGLYFNARAGLSLRGGERAGGLRCDSASLPEYRRSEERNGEQQSQGGA
jgi:hypothetical protein